MKQPKTIPTKIDVTKPVRLAAASDSCFGNEWDMGTNECASCADNLACGIVYANTMLKAKIKQQQETAGGYLDIVDMSRISVEKVLKFVDSQDVVTVGQLMDFVKLTTFCLDEVAVKEYIVRLIKEEKVIYTKDGVVCKRS